MPHAAVNELMQWVRTQGKQVVSLHSWPQEACWWELLEWFAHIDIRSTKPLHARIKREGYKFTIEHEPDNSLCPACEAKTAALIVRDAAVQAPEPVLVTRQGLLPVI
jgi:hypothetical protein